MNKKYSIFDKDNCGVTTYDYRGLSFYIHFHLEGPDRRFNWKYISWSNDELIDFLKTTKKNLIYCSESNNSCRTKIGNIHVDLISRGSTSCWLKIWDTLPTEKGDNLYNFDYYYTIWYENIQDIFSTIREAAIVYRDEAIKQYNEKQSSELNKLKEELNHYEQQFVEALQTQLKPPSYNSVDYILNLLELVKKLDPKQLDILQKVITIQKIIRTEKDKKAKFIAGFDEKIKELIE